MKETVTLTREQMSFRRRAADTLIGGGNILDIGTIAVGVFTANPVLAGAGLASFAVGKEVQTEWVRKKTIKGSERYGSHMTLPPKVDVYVGKK